jgi:hypothetical protein
MTEPRQRTERLTDRDKPMLTNTFYVDDNVVQFLVTIRGNKETTGYPERTPLGHIRRAIIDAAYDHNIDVAIAGPAPLPADNPFNHKRG